MSNLPATKVAEIFLAAGESFNKLADLTSQLSSSTDTGGRWSDQGIHLFYDALSKLKDDLQLSSSNLKRRSALVSRSNVKKKITSFDESNTSGIIRPTSNTSLQQSTSPICPVTNSQLISSNKSADVTLSMLNAPDGNEIDVEGMHDVSHDSSLK